MTPLALHPDRLFPADPATDHGHPSAFLARLVVGHRLDETEAEIAHALNHGLVKQAYRL